MRNVQPKKRVIAAVSAGAVQTHRKATRLITHCKQNNLDLLVDSGAEISAIPASQKYKDKSPISYLYAANGTLIPVFDYVILELNLGARRPYLWHFYVADIDRPILGIDFLSHFKILIDPYARLLIDSVTNVKIKCGSINSPQCYSISATPSRTNLYAEILKSFPNLVAPSNILFLPPVTNNIRHHLLTKGPPTSYRPRRLSPAQLKIAKEEFRLMMQLGICRPSSSPWAASLHMVPKDGGSWRVVGDYRALNSKTLADSYPLPHIHDFTLSLADCTIFSRIDLIRAYNQILVAEEDIPKTAVITPFGLFEFVRMPMGLRNSAQTFQRFIDNILQDLPFAYAYLDDLLIASKSEAEHAEHLRIVLERLHQHGVTINASKSVFGQSTITFIGHELSSTGVRPLANKIEAIQSYPLPQDICSLRKFLGMLNFYHRFVPQIATLQAPLNDLTKNSKKKRSYTHSME